MYALIDISNQMLEDSAFDMEGEIRDEATEQFAVKEGAESAAPSGPARSHAASTKLRALAQGTHSRLMDSGGFSRGGRCPVSGRRGSGRFSRLAHAARNGKFQPNTRI
jgi:hypothetical protein